MSSDYSRQVKCLIILFYRRLAYFIANNMDVGELESSFYICYNFKMDYEQRLLGYEYKTDTWTSDIRLDQRKYLQHFFLCFRFVKLTERIIISFLLLTHR